MRQTPHAKTLLAHVLPRSVGIRTSLLGRIAFIAATTIFVLWRLRASPDDYITHTVLFVSELVAVAVIATPSFLFGKCIPLVLLSCVLIGVLNWWFRRDALNGLGSNIWMYGASRGTAYAALSLASLLVASITRPSDLVRLVSRVSIPWSVFLILAIPLSATSSLASRYRDMLFVARATRTGVWFRDMLHIVLHVATSLFAAAIHQSMYIYQVAQACRPISGNIGGRRRQFFSAPIVAVEDLSFVAILLPALVVVSRMPAV